MGAHGRRVLRLHRFIVTLSTGCRLLLFPSLPHSATASLTTLPPSFLPHSSSCLTISLPACLLSSHAPLLAYHFHVLIINLYASSAGKFKCSDIPSTLHPHRRCHYHTSQSERKQGLSQLFLVLLVIYT